MTLTCVNQLPQRLPAQTQFRFLRNDRALVRDWAHSPQYQVAAVWSEDSGFYWCEVRTAARRLIKSKDVRIDIQSERPTGGVVAGEGGLLPAGGWLFEACPQLPYGRALQLSSVLFPLKHTGGYSEKPYCVFHWAGESGGETCIVRGLITRAELSRHSSVHCSCSGWTVSRNDRDGELD